MGICTMNIFIPLIIFGIVSECSSKNIGQATGYQNFIEERCRSNMPEAILKDKMHIIKKPDYGMSAMGMLIGLEGGNFCSDLFQLTLTSTLHNYTEALMYCFLKEEKYIPKFINDTYHEYLNLLCSSNGKTLDDLFSSEASVCLKNLKKANVEKCESRLTLLLNATLTKNQVCSDLKNTKKCQIGNFQKHCSNQTNYIAAVNKIFGAIDKPCNDIEDTSEDENK